MLSIPTKARILVVGYPLMVRRLAAKIEPEQFCIVDCRNSAEAAELLARQSFEMVIVDNLVPEADVVCRNAAALGTAPITLLLQTKPVDWRGMSNMMVDGFIADTGTNAEFTARLRALMRRKPLASAYR
jgi:DNA-binding response OmpR family regulator